MVKDYRNPTYEVVLARLVAKDTLVKKLEECAVEMTTLLHRCKVEICGQWPGSRLADDLEKWSIGILGDLSVSPNISAEQYQKGAGEATFEMLGWEESRAIADRLWCGCSDCSEKTRNKCGIKRFVTLLRSDTTDDKGGIGG